MARRITASHVVWGVLQVCYMPCTVLNAVPALTHSAVITALQEVLEFLTTERLSNLNMITQQGPVSNPDILGQT